MTRKDFELDEVVNVLAYLKKMLPYKMPVAVLRDMVSGRLPLMNVVTHKEYVI